MHAVLGGRSRPPGQTAPRKSLRGSPVRSPSGCAYSIEWGGFGELYPTFILEPMYRTLEYLGGISDDDVRRLRSVGIRHTNQLLHRASLDIDRRRLAKKTGVSADRPLEFVNQCTLLEVSGLERWVPLIRRLGINSMPDLGPQDAVAVHAKLLGVAGPAYPPTRAAV